MPTNFTACFLALTSLWLLNFSRLCFRQSRLQDFSYSDPFIEGFQLRRLTIPTNRNSTYYDILEKDSNVANDRGGNSHDYEPLHYSLKSMMTTVTTEEDEDDKWVNPLNVIEKGITEEVYTNQHTRLFPREISSFQDLLNIDTDFSTIPRNLHIAFAGDSLTRYQYLSLAYFFKHGKWINPDEVPNMTIEKQHSTWRNFYNFTKSKLAPYEQCDCFRPEGHKMPLMMENRYFHDPLRNNSLSFFQKFGHKFTFKSNWNVSDVHNVHDLITREDQLNFQLETEDWPYFIRNFVEKLNPKPTFFVFNEGIHAHRDFTNKKVRRQIVRALRESGMIGVYKTTTKYRLHNITNNNIIETSMIRDYELDFCKKVDLCLDLSWTWHVPMDYYSDYAHFKEPVYSWQNVQLMELLGVDNRYYKQMKQQFVGRKSQIDLSFV